MLRCIVLWCLFLVPVTASGQTATLDAPDAAKVGSRVKVTWTGPGTQYDQIRVYAAEAEDSARPLDAGSITSGKNPITVQMPEDAGLYELRYYHTGTKSIIGRRPITVDAVPATLSAPATADMGSRVTVHWTGPGNTYDLISLYPQGAADDARRVAGGPVRGSKSTVEFKVPEQPGDYEIRYVTAKKKYVLARTPITVVEVQASLSAAAEGKIGERFDVSWEGPGNTYDLITIYPAGAPDDARAAAKHSITGKRNPVTLRLPEQPGAYEIRYQLSKSKRVLARQPLTIVGMGASLSAPDTGASGSKIEVYWEGPGNTYDLVALFPQGAPDNAAPIKTHSITSKANPFKLRLPETPGNFELRYLLAKSKQVLARRAIVITPVTAALHAADKAVANTKLPVTWEGPGNTYDRVDLHTQGAPDNAEPISGASITSRRNPVIVKLPESNGTYELRYITAQSKQVLARRALLIQPSGRLRVSLSGQHTLVDRQATQSRGGSAVALILDASGSMLQRLGEHRRIEIARDVLTEIVRDYLPDDQPVALRVFGHRTPDACQTDLEIPLAPLDRDAMAARIAAINAKNLAKTPIADSLAMIPSDLSGADGPKAVILITDGEETCEGDPAQVIAGLRAQGLDVQVSIVGFAIDDPALQSEFQEWATLGGGSYFNANSADELLRSLRTVISGPYRVLDKDGKEIARGVIGGKDLVLPAGTYRVETLRGTARARDDVVITPESLTELSFE